MIFSKDEVQKKSIPENILGVYYFLDENNNILYIGKSINIKKRIHQHLANGRKRLLNLMPTIQPMRHQLIVAAIQIQIQKMRILLLMKLQIKIKKKHREKRKKREKRKIPEKWTKKLNLKNKIDSVTYIISKKK